MILQLANLELNVRKWIPSCEINLRDFRKSPCNMRNLHAKWDICAPTLLDLFFRYFCINFHFLLVFNHSCNSLARKCPRKGKLPSYINSLVNTKKGTLGEICNHVIHRSIYRIYRALLCFFSFSFIFIFLLAKHSLRIFP